MDAHHASIVLGTVTQDFDYARFEEEASTDDIAGESTWELLQLPLTWDVWLSHISIQTKRNAYSAQKDRNNREGAPSGLEHVTRERRRSSVAHDKPTTFQPRGFHHQVSCNAKLKVSRWFNVRRGSRTYSRRWRTVNQSRQRDATQFCVWEVWLSMWIERVKRPANPASPCITAIRGHVVGPFRALCLSNCCSIETWYKGAQDPLLYLSRHDLKVSPCERSIYLPVEKRWTKFGAVLVLRRWLQLQVLPFEGGGLT